MFNFNNREEILALLREYKGRILGLLLGFFTAVLILTVGLIATIFILMLMGIGFYAGYRYDKKQSIEEIINEILPPRK